MVEYSIVGSGSGREVRRDPYRRLALLFLPALLLTPLSGRNIGETTPLRKGASRQLRVCRYSTYRSLYRLHLSFSHALLLVKLD